MHSSRWWLWNPRLSLVLCSMLDARGYLLPCKLVPQMFPKARPRHLEGSLLKSVGAHLGKCSLKIFQWLNKSVWVVFRVLCQEIFFGDVVKGGSSLLEDLRKMKSSPQNLRLAEQDDKSGYQLHLLRQCLGFPGVLGTNTADVEG